MNLDSGELYESMQAAIEAGEKKEDLVEVRGTREQVEKLSRKVKMATSIKEKPHART